MKKIAFLLIAFAVVVASCKKEKEEDNDKKEEPVIPVETLNPKQEQWGFVLNYSAKWCGPCGSWGAPLLADLAAMNSGKVMAIKPHASNDPMHIQALYSSFAADRPTGGGIPSFWVGDNKVTSSSATNTMNTLIAQTASAGIDMKTTKNADNFSVEAKVKFFSAGTGDYYLSFYILEDGIPGGVGSGTYQQNGTSDPDYKHNHVLRASHTTNVYGELLATDPAANATFDKNITFNFNTDWDNTIYVVAALWKYDPSGNPSSNIPRYKFINGFVKK